MCMPSDYPTTNRGLQLTWLREQIVVAKITKSGVDIKYMYSFMFGGHGIVVFRADNNDKAEEVMMLEKLDYITEKDLQDV